MKFLRIRPSVLVALAALLFTTAMAHAQDREYIVLSGGPSLIKWEKYKAQPHDLWWMNFVRAARLRIQELREQHGPDAKITWLVYSEGYRKRGAQDNADLISNITSVRDAYNVKLVFFDQAQQVFDYLNHGEPRDQVKIADFEYFGHSNRACWMFDYSSNVDSASKIWIHEDDLKKLDRGIFTRDAYAKSWGCHTGESMSAKFSKATGVKMWGAIGKTQYETEKLPTLSSDGGKWVLR